MTHAVPHARLQAEAHAFPLASEAAFRHRVTALSRRAAGVLDGGVTSRLALELEAEIRPRAGGMSVEVLRQLRDGAWFRADHSHVPLGEHLEVLATDYLELAGNRARLRDSGDLAEIAGRWRWLVFYLPSDLLIAARAARDGVEPPDDAVSLASPRLADLLREPCAETHLHVGAGIPFSLLWAARMRDLATESALKLKPGSGRPPFGSAGAFRAMLLAAAIGRLLLASFLRRRAEAGGPASFRSFIRDQRDAIAERVPWGLGEHAARRDLVRALDHLWSGSGGPAVERMRRLYQALVHRPRRFWEDHPPASIADVARADPLADWLTPQNRCVLPEARFAYRAMGYLRGEGARDDSFAGLFWQYQRVRCLTYRFLVEEPGTAGLDWFTRHYARVSPMKGTVGSLIYASALEMQSRGLHLGALEARTSPERHWTLVRDEVRALAAQAARYEPRPALGPPEVGLVLHFIKEWERTLPNKEPRLHADPRQPGFGCRFGAWSHARMREAMAIATALERHPELLLVLRGIDIANVELAEPTWPLVLLFERVRAASRRASARLARLRPDWDATPLRVTVHAGEDFRRLVEGLRRIHEPIEFGLVQTGDRIGHGVALGEDPARWADAARTVTQPAEERLDDLTWELTHYQRGELSADAGRLEKVRAEAVRLGREIYGDERVDADELVEARRLRHQAAVLTRLGYPLLRSLAPDRGPAQLLYRHLTDGAVFERGQRPQEVRADEGEVEMLRAAQRWLRRELGRREITVECNPSSNLVIADYLALEDHAAFRMQPLPWMREPDGGGVLVSVNTDNPITFASCLADELAHLYFALLRRGVLADDALLWIGRARENGFRSRFTLRASAAPAELDQLVPAARRPGSYRERGAGGLGSRS